MAATSQTSIHFKADDVGHDFKPGPGGFATLDIGKPGDVEYYLHFNGHPEKIHAVIAHLVALENEMNAAAPVITDSERDCDERNPDGSGEPCHRGGDHGVHRDSNGDEWRTDLPKAGTALLGELRDRMAAGQ